jgi:E3 ubiquitin-protein ligase UBR7
MSNLNNEEQSYTINEVLGNINKEIMIVSKFKNKKDLKTCSYEKGHTTQEVFVCKTCYKETGKMAGLCGGCAFNCHEDHEIDELGFKRGFRCDCGNSKFCK